MSARRAVDVGVLLLLVSCLVLPWHASNHKLPHFDAADFAITTLEIEHRFEASLTGGFAAAYLHRGWRPILFPVVAVPFFAIAGGQLRAGIALTQCGMLFVAGLYTLALARRFLTRGRALLAAALVVSLPWMIQFSLVFYAELAWVACTAGWLYHSIAADGYRSRAHSAWSGVWLALMIAVRPVESLLVGAPAMAMLAIRAWQRGRSFPPGVLWASVPALALAALWWGPFTKELYDWAYATSFGQLAQVTDQRYRGVALWAVLREVTSFYAQDQFVTLGTAATAGWIAWRLRRKADGPPFRLVVLGLIMLAPIIAVLMWTGTSSPRRPAPAMFVVFVALTTVLLHEALPWLRVRTALVGLIAALQIALVVINGVDARPGVLAPTYARLCEISPPSAAPDVNVAVVNALERDGVAHGRVATYSWCYYDDLSGCSTRGLPWFEPAAMTAASRSQRLDLQFSFHNGLDLSRPEHVAEELRSTGFSYVVLDLFDQGKVQRSEIPYLVVTSALIATVSRDGRIPGLVPVRRYDLGGRTIVVFKVDPASFDTAPIAEVPIARISMGG